MNEVFDVMQKNLHLRQVINEVKTILKNLQENSTIDIQKKNCPENMDLKKNEENYLSIESYKRTQSILIFAIVVSAFGNIIIIAYLIINKFKNTGKITKAKRIPHKTQNHPKSEENIYQVPTYIHSNNIPQVLPIYSLISTSFQEIKDKDSKLQTEVSLYATVQKHNPHTKSLNDITKQEELNAKLEAGNLIYASLDLLDAKYNKTSHNEDKTIYVEISRHE